MSWTHSSKAVALGVLLAITLGAVGTAAAVSFTEESAPDSKEVGEEATIEVTMEDLYADDLPNEWELKTGTELQNPDWTVIVRDAAGEEVARQEEATESITQVLSSDQNHVEVQVTVTGEVPEIESYRYENIEQESITALNITQVVEGGTSNLEGGEWTIHQYTSDSQNARDALDNAREALNGTNNQEAQSRFDEAKSFYKNEEFDRAITAAEDVQDMAGSSDDSGLPLPLIIGAVAVLVVLIGGGIYYYQQSQQQTSKLQ